MSHEKWNTTMFMDNPVSHLQLHIKWFAKQKLYELRNRAVLFLQYVALNQTVQWLVLICSWSKAMKNKAGLSLCTKQYQWGQPPQTQGSFDYGLSQWETTLQCKVVSHQLNPYHELWSVTRDQAPLFVYLCFSLFYITWPAESGRSRNFQWLSRKNPTANTLMPETHSMFMSSLLESCKIISAPIPNLS